MSQLYFLGSPASTSWMNHFGFVWVWNLHSYFFVSMLFNFLFGFGIYIHLFLCLCYLTSQKSGLCLPEIRLLSSVNLAHIKYWIIINIFDKMTKRNLLVECTKISWIFEWINLWIGMIRIWTYNILDIGLGFACHICIATIYLFLSKTYNRLDRFRNPNQENNVYI